jgi:hypothetical protein
MLEGAPELQIFKKVSYQFLNVFFALIEDKFLCLQCRLLESLDGPTILQEVDQLIHSFRPINILLNRFYDVMKKLV